MAKEDVERFVGLLVSDDDFVKDVSKDFDRAIAKRNITFDKKEGVILREGIDVYVKQPARAGRVTGPGTVAVPVAVAVAAAVAGSVAGNVATKVVDKVTGSKILTPMNERIREVILSRGLLTKADFRTM